MVFWLATVEAREGVRDGGFMGVAFVTLEATVYRNRHICCGRKDEDDLQPRLVRRRERP